MSVSKLEQLRRDFKAENPDLYAYIYHIESAKALNGAGDTVSGAIDGHAAGNRLWKESARHRAAAKEMEKE